jgi:stringent starvation protein B
MKDNLRNPNKSYYQYWMDDYTHVMGVYDKETGKGIERMFKLDKEYEINKTIENDKDKFMYQE